MTAVWRVTLRHSENIILAAMIRLAASTETELKMSESETDDLTLGYTSEEEEEAEDEEEDEVGELLQSRVVEDISGWTDDERNDYARKVQLFCSPP